MTDLPKTYDPSSIEPTIYRLWLDNDSFRADPKAPGEPYSIVIPPPNVTGALHLGHAINNTLQDILTRVHRMRGRNALWVPGIDHAGIATQAVVEKQLKEKENKTRHDLGREALVARIWQWKEQYGDRIIEQLKRLGSSADFSRTRFTLDEGLARAVRQTFFKLFKDGLIFKGKRLVNWDIHLQTSISDDEIYHETVKTSLWHVKYPIEGTDKHMVVATTRPETMLGDTAVAVHPDDPRWNWAIGKSVILPLLNKTIPIIADPILVNMEFGSGVVKVTPAHDPNDYATWQRQGGKIDIVNILTPEGRINENGGPYKGLKREVARKKVVEDLTAQGLLEKEEPYETQIGHSDRSKTPIEPYLSDQWFVRMAPLAEPALEVVRNGKIKFFPERHAQQYLSWLGEKRDWPISRQLWWGHRIPIWTKEIDASAAAPIDSLQSLEVRGTQIIMRTVIEENRGFNYVCIPPGHPEIEKEFEAQGFIQDPDVLDTWFSSALWPHSTLGWPDKTDDLKTWYPTSVLVTGRDIITLWVARMVMTGLYNMGDIPFHHVAINPIIMDGKGERMSKSKGNGVDPVEIIEAYGADALRFTLTQMATETQDVRLPVKKLPDGRNTSEKFDLGRNFANKLWNASRFAIANLASIAPQDVDEKSWTIHDRWILSRLMRTIQEADAALAAYRFDLYAKACYDFFWRDLCDWYIEAIKPELKDGQRQAQVANILTTTLDQSLRLLHPIIPFITETIWQNLNTIRASRALKGRIEAPPSDLLINAKWPEFNDDLTSEGAEHVFTQLQGLIIAIRNIRNEYKVDPRTHISISIAAPGDASRQILANKSLIENLAIGKLLEVSPDLACPPYCARGSASSCDIYAHNLTDATAEEQRLTRRRDELMKQRAALKGRMTETYIAKAPPQLVKQTQDQLAEIEAELARLS
ncbi:MAG TPA: valine--tRNA ligase [Tepidisphaeraceae bacterium]|nr:valine--tRNA ligase [Tepidisphaeraceae bacterium]